MSGVRGFTRRLRRIHRRRDREVGEGYPRSRHQGGVSSPERSMVEAGTIMKDFRAIAAVLGGLCLLAAGVPASAQSWPSAKPITIIVPVPPGPSIDMIARLVAGKLGDALGQT